MLTPRRRAARGSRARWRRPPGSGCGARPRRRRHGRTGRPAGGPRSREEQVEGLARVVAVGEPAPHLDPVPRRGGEHGREALQHEPHMAGNVAAPARPDLGHEGPEARRDSLREDRGPHRVLLTRPAPRPHGSPPERSRPAARLGWGARMPPCGSPARAPSGSARRKKRSPRRRLARGRVSGTIYGAPAPGQCAARSAPARGRPQPARCRTRGPPCAKAWARSVGRAGRPFRPAARIAREADPGPGASHQGRGLPGDPPSGSSRGPRTARAATTGGPAARIGSFLRAGRACAGEACWLRAPVVLEGLLGVAGGQQHLQARDRTRARRASSTPLMPCGSTTSVNRRSKRRPCSIISSASRADRHRRDLVAEAHELRGHELEHLRLVLDDEDALPSASGTRRRGGGRVRAGLAGDRRQHDRDRGALPLPRLRSRHARPIAARSRRPSAARGPSPFRSPSW